MTALPNQLFNQVSILSLRCFVAVVETQSFSAAARQLTVAPSSVTKQVQLMESAANVALVHRTTRRVSVTEAGERFYEHCLAILNEIDNASVLTGADKQVTGHLRVTAPPAFAGAMLGRHIHAFMEEHPAISIDLSVTSATPDLIRSRIDVAIMLSDQPQSKLTHFCLGSCTPILCASPDYLTHRITPKQLDDLNHLECLSARFSELAASWRLGRQGCWQTVTPHFKLLSDNGELLRQACLGGAGIAALYDFHIQDDLRAGRLVRVLPKFEFASNGVFAIIPHKTIVRPQAKVFIDFVRRLVAEPGINRRAAGPSLRSDDVPKMA
ncbi:LysR family transcriptional regulator [Bradyrhizobium liaoningense]|uniref:LysR family transcriptional regulator n=1 Tax=Bradyrhizobium liaoningense TaxID=43992 RepID=UPI001BAE181D|nr:LysR family transcriptional regulator [Bradyrhizobium liaoningense]MBR0859120.1 LysR family transcriptional regulator [Bradyrhizobium liaoningense]